MSNTMWGGGQRDPRPPGPGYRRPSTYATYFAISSVYYTIAILRYQHHPAQLVQFAYAWIIATFAAGPLIFLGARWLGSWLGRRRP
jgi:hypothetical protein